MLQQRNYVVVKERERKVVIPLEMLWYLFMFLLCIVLKDFFCKLFLVTKKEYEEENLKKKTQDYCEKRQFKSIVYIVKDKPIY